MVISQIYLLHAVGVRAEVTADNTSIVFNACLTYTGTRSMCPEDSGKVLLQEMINLVCNFHCLSIYNVVQLSLKHPLTQVCPVAQVHPPTQVRLLIKVCPVSQVHPLIQVLMTLNHVRIRDNPDH